MAMEYFCCFHAYRKKLESLSDSEKGRLWDALMIYSETGERAKLNGREAIAFDFIASDIDAAKEKYAQKCRTNKQNREKGTSTTVDDRARPSTNNDETHQTKNKKQKTKISPNGDINPPLSPQGGTGAARPAKFSAKACIEQYTQDAELRQLLFDWLEVRKKARAPETERAISENLRILPQMAQESGLTLQDYMREVVRRGWRAFYPAHSDQRRNDGRGFDWLTGQ